MADQEKKETFWKSFVSLNWYDGAIEFLFRFVAKTSEPLLAAGIVYSAADVLSKGHLGSTNTTMDTLWAISQALAIESSGGVVLVYGLESFKAKDRVKAWIYLVLSALLAITGGVMLFMQLAGLENQQADSLLMRGLFALRCVVSVGYIYLCRTKSMSFRNLDKDEPAVPATPALAPAPAPPTQEQQPAQIDYQQLAQELAPLLHAVRTTIIEEVKASITPAPPVHSTISASDQRQVPAPSLFIKVAHQEQAPAISASYRKLLNQRQHRLPTVQADISATREKQEPEPAPPQSASQEERLENAYQELLRENKRVSGRALSERAKVHRTTCNQWLKEKHPEKGTGTETDSGGMQGQNQEADNKASATQGRYEEEMRESQLESAPLQSATTIETTPEQIDDREGQAPEMSATYEAQKPTAEHMTESDM